jgi:hypothetical protein
MSGASGNALTVECRYRKFEVVMSEAFVNACKHARKRSVIFVVSTSVRLLIMIMGFKVLEDALTVE